MQDREIIDGLLNSSRSRNYFEKELYQQYQYFIRQGCLKYRLSQEDSFSAYSDAVLSAINNITEGRFDQRVSLKTYLFQIFHHKSVDLIRKITNHKGKVHQSAVTPELLGHLPETARSIVEKLIDQERIKTIERNLALMGEKCKEILLLFADGYTDQQIAELLTYNSAAVVKTTRLRCREKLTKLSGSHE